MPVLDVSIDALVYGSTSLYPNFFRLTHTVEGLRAAFQVLNRFGVTRATYVIEDAPSAWAWSAEPIRGILTDLNIKPDIVTLVNVRACLLAW